jgi:type IV pilus assembly protein PilY1
MFIYKFHPKYITQLVLASSLLAAGNIGALTIPNQPLSAQPSAKPMIMLALGRDHRLFYEAYNDASDIDGDGIVDIRFKPGVTYLGLFNSNYCYTHNNQADNTGVFTPAGLAGTDRKCNLSTGGQWSGNWLNYATTSRIDALRVVLYGGMRDVDTASSTVLRRAYIPQDAHSWAKEYTSEAEDGYKISDYTPISQPLAGRRHFFGNATRNADTNCVTLSSCSDLPPMLTTVMNSSKRVWAWASTERPVQQRDNPIPENETTQSITHRSVRVEVCTASYNQGCKSYGSSRKPVGILHDFGENESALFGLMTGSYDSNTKGGRLRKVISSFKDEVNQTDGTYKTSADIVNTINALRITDFNNNRVDRIYEGGVIGNRAINNGENSDWGNPIAEIMYEAVRYMANQGSPTTQFTSIGTAKDDRIGLPKPAWDKPFDSTSAAKAPWCARSSLLTISDSNISYDSDDLPGSNWPSAISTSLTGKSILSGGAATTFNASNAVNAISANEPSVQGSRFIGQAGVLNDFAPTAKNVANLSNIRGLAPEEPTKQGSYYSAGVSYYAKTNDLQTSRQGNQTIDSYVVALASPLLRIEVPMSNGKSINILPFAKSISGAFGITATTGSYQPTNQIVDFYVESVINTVPNTTTTNGGRYQAKFRINFEDVEQGNDHDMDAIVEYTVRATSSTQLEIVVRPTYQAGGVRHRMGYVISGSTQDGVYLEVQDEGDTQSYFLNTPPGRAPGYCNQATPPADCGQLPRYRGVEGTGDPATRTFSVSTSPAASFLKDPLWFAAKWGGFQDGNNNGIPDLPSEWDRDGDGVPDTYFFVQNPTKLKDSLTNAFNAIIERNSSASNIATNNRDVLNSNTRVYRASFTAGVWSGEVTAFPVTKNGVGASPVWEASTRLPAWASRKIYMHTGNSSNAQVDLRSTAFTSLPSTIRTWLVNEDNLDYVRGNRSKELKNGGSLRNRDSALGDFIHSSPVVDTDANTLFIGSNAGMLHALDLNTGDEKFSVIPRAAVSRLKNLTDSSYNANHEYFVDGELSLGFSLAASNNTKYIYTLLGRGGKGLFSGKAAGTNWTRLWEYSSFTTPGATDLDLGLMISRPLYALMNNNKAALIVGNGYNSTSGSAVLYIFILNSDGTLDSTRKIDTGVAGDNGLSGPAFVDTNADGKADFIYAGDRLGNLWKFDVSSNNSTLWGLSVSGQPLFKATDPSGNPQAITAPVYIAKNSQTTSPHFGKNYIFFGTGQYLATGDNLSTQTHAIYGIIDSTSQVNKSNLTERTILTTGTITGTVTASTTAGRVFSTATVGDMTGKSGWYMNLTAPFPGERVIGRAQIVPTMEISLLVPSLYPINDDPCVPGGSGYFNFFNPWDGARINLDLFDLNRNGKFDSSDRIAGQAVSSVNLGIGIPTVPLFIPNQRSAQSGGSNPFGLTGGDASSIASETKRFLDGNGGEIPDPKKDCVDSGQIIGSGSEGTASLTTRCAAGGNLRGRVQWREIIRD